MFVRRPLKHGPADSQCAELWVTSIWPFVYLTNLARPCLSTEHSNMTVGHLDSCISKRFPTDSWCFYQDCAWRSHHLFLIYKDSYSDWVVFCDALILNCALDVWRLTHWGRVTQICVGKLTIIGSDNGLSPDRRQAIIWTNAGILLIGPLETNFSEILIEILTFHSRKCGWKCCLRNGGHLVSASMC